MDMIFSKLDALDFNAEQFLSGSGILILCVLVIGLIARFIFGKRSDFNHAVSSAIGILFLYILTVVLYSLGGDWSQYVAPLPFVTFSGDSLTFFSFRDIYYASACSELLSMIILAFLVNILDIWLPKGKGFFGWLLGRCFTVILALVLHLLVTKLFATYLPEGIVVYAPTVLLWILLIMLAVGALKFLVGLLLATVNPLIGALYTFFFASLVGRQISKAVLSTAILLGLFYGLEHFGITSIVIASAALMAYVPLLIILILMWYFINRVL